VGLDRAAATEALDRFLSDRALTRAQLDFVSLVVEQLTANGILGVARLYESPFTDSAPHGPDMIFTDEQVDGIVVILDQVRAHAAPTSASA